ncbi:MAG: hypothetical protein ACPL1K_08005, partial [Candidatus Kryptoniota bacterium]
IKICPPNSSISGISWIRLSNLSDYGEELHMIFIDSSPYDFVSAGDKFVLDSSAYGNGSRLIVAFIPMGYEIIGNIEIA